MKVDAGEVLPGLHETWTFLGANALEWGAGLIVFLLISLFFENVAAGMPFMLLGWVLTTVQLAVLRKMYPDEERGVRNAFMSACGFPPIDIPPPSSMQHIWSATPLGELSKESRFVKLGLNDLFFCGEEMDEEKEGGRCAEGNS